MPIECDGERQALVLFRIGQGLPNDLLMTEVNAIEHSDGQRDFLSAGLEIICAVERLHRRDYSARVNWKNGMTRFSSSGSDHFKICSSGAASFTENFPESRRRNDFK